MLNLLAAREAYEAGTTNEHLLALLAEIESSIVFPALAEDVHQQLEAVLYGCEAASE